MKQEERYIYSGNTILNDIVNELYKLCGLREADPDGYMGAAMASIIYTELEKNGIDLDKEVKT